MYHASKTFARSCFVRCSSKVQAWPHHLRYLTTKTSERVRVACQSNGHITLDIYQPSKVISESAKDTKVLIYLPRGPYLHNEQDDESTLATLRSVLTCPVVRINYRLSVDRPYPTPIHDVLHGYDWIKENLLPARAIGRAGRSERVGKLAVCGELIGGGLATMLALTECRIGEPGIVALAANNPLVDWVSLDGMTKFSKKATRTKSSLPPTSDAALVELRALRTQLFKRADDYFDPFASPILFLRSAGVAVPPAPPPPHMPHDDLACLSMLERESADGVEDQARAASTVTEDQHSSTSMRKVSRRFPSKALRLKLPLFYISSGSQSPLYSQDEELTSLLRKSIAREALLKTSHSAAFGHKLPFDVDDDSDARLETSPISQDVTSLECNTNDSIGFWDSTNEGTDSVWNVAKWVKDKM